MIYFKSAIVSILALSSPTYASVLDLQYSGIGGIGFSIEQDLLPTSLANSELKLYNISYNRNPNYSYSIANSSTTFTGYSRYLDGFITGDFYGLGEESSYLEISFDKYGRIYKYYIDVAGDPCSWNARFDRGGPSSTSCAYAPYNDPKLYPNSNFSTSIPGSWTVTGAVAGASPVPLPSSLTGMFLGLLSLAFWRRNTKRKVGESG